LSFLRLKTTNKVLNIEIYQNKASVCKINESNGFCQDKMDEEANLSRNGEREWKRGESGPCASKSAHKKGKERQQQTEEDVCMCVCACWER
jgi:hypothetical protein